MTIQIFLTTLAILAGVILLLLILILILVLTVKAKVALAYRDTSGFSLAISLLGIRIIKLPSKKQKRVKFSDYPSKKEKKVKKTTKKKPEKAPEPEKKKKPPIMSVLTIVKQLLGGFFDKYSRRIKVRVARLHIRVAAGDAASSALLYGAVIQAVAYILGLLDRYTDLSRLRKNEVSVIPDFTAGEFSADILIVLKMPVRTALALLLRFLRLRAALPDRE